MTTLEDRIIIPKPPLEEYPPVPLDLDPNRISSCYKRAAEFRDETVATSASCRCCGPTPVDTTKRNTLLALCTPEQRLTLICYGFIEQIGSRGRKFRIHWSLGNNVSVFHKHEYYVRNRAYDCYIRNGDLTDKIISNLLAIRIDEAKFVDIACGSDPLEYATDGVFDDDRYISRNRLRAKNHGISLTTGL